MIWFMLFAINAIVQFYVVIPSDFWEVVSTRLFFLKDRARVHIFSRKPSNKWFSSNFDPYPAGLHPGFSNEAMWWSCPMALCGCTTSEAPDGSLMATKTSSKVFKWPEYAPVILQIIYSILIYIYGYIMIYQYMHIEFYLSFPLIYAGGLDGLPNEGIQMQIGLKCPGTDVGLCWDAAWSSPSHSACVTCDLPRWVEWQKPRQASNQIWRTRGSRPSR